jgi:metal-responsive CopG/Arc/MetJ family transcriptional regulator
MKTIQMTLDDDLVKSVDRVSKELRQSRSAFTRAALRESLAQYRVAKEEKRHREGYEEQPVAEDEFADWEAEQDWGDA